MKNLKVLFRPNAVSQFWAVFSDFQLKTARFLSFEIAFFCDWGIIGGNLGDERGVFKTAQCAVLPREMSERIRPARTVSELSVALTDNEKNFRSFH